MTDVHSKEVRSYNMSRIKGKDTKPELIVRKFLFSKGYRYRLHIKNLPGSPDIVLPKYKTAIFIHGCFWHGHENCRYYSTPKTNSDWWIGKIAKNIENDKAVNRKLKDSGWKIITVWGCDLKPTKLTNTLAALLTHFESISNEKKMLLLEIRFYYYILRKLAIFFLCKTAESCLCYIQILKLSTKL